MFKYYLMASCKPSCPLWCYPIHHKWCPKLLFVSDLSLIAESDNKFKQFFPEHSKFNGISVIMDESVNLSDLYSDEFLDIHLFEDFYFILYINHDQNYTIR